MSELTFGEFSWADHEAKQQSNPMPCLWHPDDQLRLFPIGIVDINGWSGFARFNVSHSKTGAAVVMDPYNLDKAREAVGRILELLNDDDELKEIWQMEDHEALLKQLGPQRRTALRELREWAESAD